VARAPGRLSPALSRPKRKSVLPSVVPETARAVAADPAVVPAVPADSGAVSAGPAMMPATRRRHDEIALVRVGRAEPWPTAFPPYRAHNVADPQRGQHAQADQELCATGHDRRPRSRNCQFQRGRSVSCCICLREYAAGPLGLPEVLAEVDEGNAASAAVEDRPGLTRFDAVGLPGPMTRYRRTR
jgi:hypothetical protein